MRYISEKIVTIGDSKRNQEQRKWWEVEGIVEGRECDGQYDIRYYNFEDLEQGQIDRSKLET